jgi:hypothetical protein
VEWTSGRQCSSLGRRGSTGVGEACGVVSWAGGGWAVADVGAQLVEEETAREELTPRVLAVGSGSKEVLVKAGDEGGLDPRLGWRRRGQNCGGDGGLS